MIAPAEFEHEHEIAIARHARRQPADVNQDGASQRVLSAARRAIGDHPTAALAVAAAVGLAAGWLLKRGVR